MHDGGRGLFATPKKTTVARAETILMVNTVDSTPCLAMCYRPGRHHKRYNIITIMLRYIFVLSNHVLTLLRSVIASMYYVLLWAYGTVIPSYL